MLTTAELTENLENFIGTQGYHRWSILFQNMVLTDGCQYLAEKAGAYWLMDAIASHQKHWNIVSNPALKAMQFWELNVNLEKRTAILACREDSDKPIAVSQKIPFTDFPLTQIKIWVSETYDDDGKRMLVFMLKSEY